MSGASAAFATLGELAAAAGEWGELCGRAAPNPFAEPAFLLPLIAYERPRVAFVLVRENGRLTGFAALRLPPVGPARVWTSAYAALPALALENAAALAALLALLRRRTWLSGLSLPLVEEGSALRGWLDALGSPLVVTARTRRAALKLSGAAAFDAALDRERARKWARKARKLKGLVEATPGPDGIEAFLDVERKGWKGARRSALADDPARAAFARAMLAAFARAGRLDALTLRLDGMAIAVGLALIAGDRAFYWKTAYDEAHADASPGVQLTLAHSRRLAETPGLALVDSCAAEDHPMIGRVWSGALAFEDVAVALRPGGAGALAFWARWARVRAAARERLKRALNRALQRGKKD